MPLDDFIFGKVLGKGSFGSVIIVTRKQDNKQYAMKRVNINNLSENSDLLQYDGRIFDRIFIIVI